MENRESGLGIEPQPEKSSPLESLVEEMRAKGYRIEKSAIPEDQNQAPPQCLFGDKCFAAAEWWIEGEPCCPEHSEKLLLQFKEDTAERESRRAKEAIIKDVLEKFGYTARLLNKKEHEPNFRTLEPDNIDDWANEERYQYLESIGRLRGFIYSPTDRSFGGGEKIALAEAERLAGRLGEHKQKGVDSYLRIVGMYMALGRDTNTSTGEYDDYEEKIANLLDKYLEQKDELARDALLNPLHLKVGDEIVIFDKGKKELLAHTITEVQLEDKDGLVITDDGEVYGIGDLTKQLLTAQIMQKSGENVYGGWERFSNPGAVLGQLRPGDHIGLEVTSPFDRRPKYEEFIFHGSNLAEVEKEWGRAYLPFLQSFSRERPLVTVDLELQGKISRGVDMRDVRLEPNLEQKIWQRTKNRT